MKFSTGSRVVLSLCVVLLSALPAKGAEKQRSQDGQTSSDFRVRVRLTAKQRDITFVAHGPATLADGKQEQSLAAGTYSLKLSGAKAAKQKFRLFTKTFPLPERAEAEAYAGQWRQQGYAPELMTFGKLFKGEGGKQLEGRNLWVSVAQLDSMAKATALKAKLEKQQAWGWILPETIERGQGKLSITGAPAQSGVKLNAPLRIQSTAALEVRNIDFGFWKPQRANRSYSGIIEIEVGPDGLLEVYETLPLEDYLAGVLPAEMPASWPIEALKAQAVSARSEVLASLGGKHMLEGFDFCGTEHCRAYCGAGGREKPTDRAVAETAGVVLASDGRVLPTVFSANCGGYTEDNECVWSAPPNPALRAVPDLPDAKCSSPQNMEFRKWLKASSRAYCGGTPDNFRWTKKFSANELKDILNRKYPVGTIRSIELGERGKGGRLKWVKIAGSKKTEIVRKELNIRLAFGGLKSAMFTVETDGKKGAPASFTFVGGGRGHGVGLCQDGARGMAQTGAGYQAVLKHYFTKADLVRVD